MKKHYSHNYYMAEIANCIINDGIPLADGDRIIFTEDASYQHGVREIIGLYLLIPYITNKNNQLQYDASHEQVSIYNDNDIAFSDIFGRGVTVKNLRDTLCHSFVSCEAPKGERPVIIIDDRAILSAKQHSALANTPSGSQCIEVDPQEVQDFLKRSYRLILNKAPSS